MPPQFFLCIPASVRPVQELSGCPLLLPQTATALVFLLCPIQSGICPFDQLRGGALIRAAQGDTAGAGGLETVRQREFLKFPADSLALMQDRIQRGDAPENHHEFIPAVTAENISVPGLTAEQISEKAKHFIQCHLVRVSKKYTRTQVKVYGCFF